MSGDSERDLWELVSQNTNSCRFFRASLQNGDKKFRKNAKYVCCHVRITFHTEPLDPSENFFGETVRSNIQMLCKTFHYCFTFILQVVSSLKGLPSCEALTGTQCCIVTNAPCLSVASCPGLPRSCFHHAFSPWLEKKRPGYEASLSVCLSLRVRTLTLLRKVKKRKLDSNVV